MRDAVSAKPIVSMYVKVKETTLRRDELIGPSLYEKSIRLTKLNLVTRTSKSILMPMGFAYKEFNLKMSRKLNWNYEILHNMCNIELLSIKKTELTYLKYTRSFLL